MVLPSLEKEGAVTLPRAEPEEPELFAQYKGGGAWGSSLCRALSDPSQILHVNTKWL